MKLLIYVNEVPAKLGRLVPIINTVADLYNMNDNDDFI
jgi:hypothetical protein